ncbi:hypothetical protein [Methylophaga sp. OBS4]|uniref:hypothetical protein n=1 Tax=Methylophaga sp. OBS4 TaxID=2991935 RepID=UPI002255030F|nr:hypothetical protein [Methylophaga sp. OBS4]MCX4186538.1 hypothetical protein [Methylophaga sp. OBS4]
MGDSEVFLHVQNCFSDLDDARNVLKAVRNSDGGIIREAAFKYAVIAYCRVYTGSQGKKGTPWRKLDERYIPDGFRELHDELLRCRDKMYAHSDRDILDAKVSVHEFKGQKIPFRIQNIVYPLEVMARIEKRNERCIWMECTSH